MTVTLLRLWLVYCLLYKALAEIQSFSEEKSENFNKE